MVLGVARTFDAGFVGRADCCCFLAFGASVEGFGIGDFAVGFACLGGRTVGLFGEGGGMVDGRRMLAVCPLS